MTLSNISDIIETENKGGFTMIKALIKALFCGLWFLVKWLFIITWYLTKYTVKWVIFPVGYITFIVILKILNFGLTAALAPSLIFRGKRIF